METASTPAVLLLNLPPAALGGMNLLSFTTTARFRGIKNLPRGLHFIFTGATSGFSIRHGAWFFISPRTSTSNPSSALVARSPSAAPAPELHVYKWDARKEELVAEASAAELLRWRANLGSIWREGLTPYRQSAAKDADGNDGFEEKNDWVQLTDCITAETLNRILGPSWILTSASSAARDEDDIPGLSREESRIPQEKQLGFLPVDLKQTWRLGATGRERTEAAQDRSWALGELVDRFCHQRKWEEVLGELQFCFLMVLTLNNFSCLEQWKRLLELVFTSREAVNARPDFFVRAIALLRLQLTHCADVEGGLFDMSDEGGGFLKQVLMRFKKGLDQLPGGKKQDVMDELEDLEQFMQDTHGWQTEGSFARSGKIQLEDGEEVDMDVTNYDEADEEGEYAPQIVDLTPEQMRELGYTPPVTHSGNTQASTSALSKQGTSTLERQVLEQEEEESGDLYEDNEDPEDMDSRY
ncbi:hypothetical protein M8818_007722 [Zalaria obscura]|uniref:Uncharacterized protein n=1 Tax=Zalaria obscura TaxID=2024903 RepID=A0ACC3S2W9_9PEZI